MTDPSVDNVDTPGTVEVGEATVREFRVRFTGADSYTKPVEVRAYGRLVGTWFPAGSLPASISPRAPGSADERGRLPDQGVQGVPARRDPERTPPPIRPAPSLTERQRQRDEWLRRLSKSRTSGSGY